VAQLAEQRTRNAQVGGSNPPISSIKSGLPMQGKPLLIFYFILSAEPLSFISENKLIY